MAEALVKQHHRCVVLGVYPMKGYIEEEIEGVKIFRLGSPKLKSSPSVIRLFDEVMKKKKMSKWISTLEKKYQPDLIESFEWSGPLYRKPKSKLLIRLHGSHSAHAQTEKKPFNRFLFFWEKRNYQMADGYVAVSEHMKRITQDCFGGNKPITVVYNPIHPLFESSGLDLNRNDNRILFAGKYHERKGVHELALILNELLPLNENYEFVFVGNHTTDQRNRFFELVRSDLHPRITFQNAIPQEELKKIYHTSSLMIMPTHAEAFGLTAIEAMACGCLVAMNHIASAPEIIHHGKDGLLIDIGMPSECARQIHQLLSSKETNPMRTNAKKKVLQQFTMDSILKKNMAIYHTLITS